MSVLVQIHKEINFVGWFNIDKDLTVGQKNIIIVSTFDLEGSNNFG